jgi:hypothetical protein
MTNWNLIFRRTHLYLGMLLIPWLTMYALSTVLFNHGAYFRQFRPADPQWSPWWVKDCALDVPEGTDKLRETAGRLLADNGLRGAFGVQRQGQRLNINVQNFWQPKRLIYDIEKQKLWAETKKFAWIELFSRLHFRVGYGQPGVLNNLWAVIVDVFCVTMLIWITTGLYLWWKLAHTRRWGFITIGAGVVSIVMLLLTL